VSNAREWGDISGLEGRIGLIDNIEVMITQCVVDRR
jgi:hypothetical protein